MATADALAITPDWIAAQRWFRAKARTIAALRTVDELPLTDAVRLAVVEVRYADAGSDRYLVEIGPSGAPSRGDGGWAALAARIAAGRTVEGRAGRLEGRATPALDALVPGGAGAVAGLAERRLRVEQSNTSVVLGERLILKLFRLLEPGDNPDVEIGAFLGAAGFAGTPALAGWATYVPHDGEPAAAAILQAYVPARRDGWAELLDLLASDPAAAIAAATAIGRLTRDLHDALAGASDDPAFGARPATPAETAAWRTAGEAQLAAAVGAVTGADHDALVEIAPGVRARFADAFGRAGGTSAVSRIHGDYHLGQLLATDDGFAVIDFEGEPARPLAERRAHASPLRDVAGMLRSLDYAARTAERGAHAAGFDAATWLDEARSAFLGAYGAIGPFDAALLEAFELEKACYEVRYEANNRPTWTWLPLEAIARLTNR